jgi:hypothetical protein
MAGVVHVPWYATGLRHDRLADALAEIAAVALRYGARSYAVYRYRDDRYKFLQMAEFQDYDQWEEYWYGPEFVEFRTLTSSWYQVPVLYGWTDLITSGSLDPEPVTGHQAVGGSAAEIGDNPT